MAKQSPPVHEAETQAVANVLDLLGATEQAGDQLVTAPGQLLGRQLHEAAVTGGAVADGVGVEVQPVAAISADAERIRSPMLICSLTVGTGKLEDVKTFVLYLITALAEIGACYFFLLFSKLPTNWWLPPSLAPTHRVRERRDPVTPASVLRTR